MFFKVIIYPIISVYDGFSDKVVVCLLTYLNAMVFMFRSEFFFRTTRELEYLFFLSRKALSFFFQNITLGYMTKTLNQVIFFPPPKSEYFFSNIGNQNIFFRKKNITCFIAIINAKLVHALSRR